MQHIKWDEDCTKHICNSNGIIVMFGSFCYFKYLANTIDLAELVLNGEGKKSRKTWITIILKMRLNVFKITYTHTYVKWSIISSHTHTLPMDRKMQEALMTVFVWSIEVMDIFVHCTWIYCLSARGECCFSLFFFSLILLLQYSIDPLYKAYLLASQLMNPSMVEVYVSVRFIFYLFGLRTQKKSVWKYLARLVQLFLLSYLIMSNINLKLLFISSISATENCKICGEQSAPGGIMTLCHWTQCYAVGVNGSWP